MNTVLNRCQNCACALDLSAFQAPQNAGNSQTVGAPGEIARIRPPQSLETPLAAQSLFGLRTQNRQRDGIVQDFGMIEEFAGSRRIATM